MEAGCEVGGKGNKGRQFRFSLTRAKDDDESDFHRYSGPVVFQRYASVALDQEKRAVESEQSLDCSNDAASSQNPDEFVDRRSDQEVIEGVSSLQPPAKKEQDQRTSSFYSFCQQERSWKDEHVEALRLHQGLQDLV